MFLQASIRAPRRRRHSRGFTLIELMVVVIVIAVTAALAAPTAVELMRERRSRQAAHDIALIYSTARARAQGRGSAIMVRYNSATGFQVLESIEGADAEARGEASCVSAPGKGCLSTTWTNPKNVRQVSEYHADASVQVAALDPNGSGKTDLSVCFTPGGRTFASYDSTLPTNSMAGAAMFTVQRAGAGRLRRVAILPNGAARLAL